MPVIHHDPGAMEPAYGILCRRVLGQDGFTAPVGAHQCSVPPGGKSAPHQHNEGEIFFIRQGQGSIQIGNEPEASLAPGDVVLIPAHTRHVLTNLSATEELAFTSVWFHSSGQDLEDPPAHSVLMAAPPTPNGDLHLGHLSGPYLALDAMARIRRQEGCQVHTAAGSDDHQTYVVTCAQKRDQAPAQTCDHFSESNQNTLQRMQMKPRSWLRPLHDQSYQAKVQAVLASMLEAGVVKAKMFPTVFAAQGGCLVEAYVSGNCPHCGQPTSGNGCEACFVPNICSDLVEPCCSASGARATVQPHLRLVLEMETFLPRIRHWVHRLDKPAWLEVLCRQLFQDPIPTPEFPISHPIGDWGIEVPAHLPCAGQRLFAWFEMAVGFFHMEPELANDRELLFAFGSDNAWYYLTMLPAVMLHMHPEMRLPKALLTNRFLLLDGSKFSTSRRHAIWGHEALEYLGSDFIRLCLASARPEQEEADFSLAHMEQVLQTLVEPWQAWWSTLQAQIDAAGGKLPEQRAAWEEFERGIYAELGRLWRSAQQARQPQGLSLRRQLDGANQVARLGATLAAGQAPLELSCLAAGLFARLIEPIMPTCAQQLSESLGLPLVSDGTLSLPPAGQALGRVDQIQLAQRSQLQALINSRQAVS